MKLLHVILLSFLLVTGGLVGAGNGWISTAYAGDDDHDEHEEEHEEGKTEIDAEAAKAAGVETSKAEAATIHEVLTLTGRIMLNRNTTTEVRARFPGVVKSVNVNWGDKVTKGQKLASVEANESLRVYSITAPSDGVVLKRNTNTGSVAGEDAIFTIADLSDVWAEFHVFPRNLDKVEEGQQVRVHTLQNGKSIETPITLILPTADPLSQTVIVVVSIPNKEGKWRPGMTVEGDVYLADHQVPLAVTTDAIQQMKDQSVVFVKEGNAYEMRPVRLGKADEQYVEVLSGLKAGEEYVSKGSFMIKADLGKSEVEDHD